MGLLERGGHEVTAVPTAARATASLEREEFDVLFSELHIGRHSGMALLAESRARWPRMSVVMLTERGTVENAVEALHRGAIDYLRKPIRPEQVNRVLQLVGQQLSPSAFSTPMRDPVEYARALAADGGYEVLLISPPPVLNVMGGIVHVDLDPTNPARIRDTVEEFAAVRERAAVVLAAVEELLARHREEEIISLLDAVRTLLEGKGPLAVTYDPTKITATGAIAVRASLASEDAGTTFGSLANPVRRLVLRRLGEGECTFSQAMDAAHVDDTSKFAFHLRKLAESGLIEHVSAKRYRLSERGKGAIAILDGIDRLDSESGSGNRVFAWKSMPVASR